MIFLSATRKRVVTSWSAGGWNLFKKLATFSMEALLLSSTPITKVCNFFHSDAGEKTWGTAEREISPQIIFLAGALTLDKRPSQRLRGGCRRLKQQCHHSLVYITMYLSDLDCQSTRGRMIHSAQTLTSRVSRRSLLDSLASTISVAGSSLGRQYI